MEATSGSTELEIQQEERDQAGAFFVEGEGQRLAELTYTRTGPSTVVLVHTGVSSALQGRGVARKLVEHAVEWARRTGTKVVPVCSYAKALFERTPELRDVLRAGGTSSA